jgi:hypothetical protein
LLPPVNRCGIRCLRRRADRKSQTWFSPVLQIRSNVLKSGTDRDTHPSFASYYRWVVLSKTSISGMSGKVRDREDISDFAPSWPSVGSRSSSSSIPQTINPSWRSRAAHGIAACACPDRSIAVTCLSPSTASRFAAVGSRVAVGVTCSPRRRGRRPSTAESHYRRQRAKSVWSRPNSRVDFISQRKPAARRPTPPMSDDSAICAPAPITR